MKWLKKKTCKECQTEKGCSECKKYQDKAFELEVDEELQQERLVEFWKKYRWLVYGGVFAVLLITAGAEMYRNYRAKIRLTESDLFEQAILLSYTGKSDEAKVAFEKLASSAKTGYRLLALMNLADLQMVGGEKEKGLKTLRQILDTSAQNDPLHLVNSLTYVGYQLEEGNPEDLLKILDPALQSEAFQGLATELAVPLLNKQGKQDKAKELIQRALQNPNTSDNSKARLSSLKGE